MSKTILSIKGDQFLINDQLIYKECPASEYHGLLMNARFIQGVFDDSSNPERFNRFGRTFDSKVNTDTLIKSLPAWYAKGLRGITVGFQGGGPCFTVENKTITNHPYIRTESGMIIDAKYKDRMLRIIEAADALGMIVIVSCFYPGQVDHFEDSYEITESMKAVCEMINQSGYRNLIVEICNEYNLCKKHSMIGSSEGMATLIRIAQETLVNKVPVGSSLTGGACSEEVSRASDVVLIHGNGCSRQDYYYLVQRAKKASQGKPILCNEDSQSIGNMVVSMKLGVGWGYYNNLTKQEPPTDWQITEGEDQYFTDRMARLLGLEEDTDKTALSNYYLQGINNQQQVDNQRWIRVASLYPETIDYVDFYRNGLCFYTCHSEPFSVNYESNWKQGSTVSVEGDVFEARIHLANGAIVKKKSQDKRLVNK